MAKKNLILRYGFCTVCGPVEDLTVSESKTMFTITWDNSIQSFTKYRFKLIHIKSDSEEEIIREENTTLKYITLLKSYLYSGQYRFEIYRICGNQESSLVYTTFDVNKIFLEQRLINWYDYE